MLAPRQSLAGSCLEISLRVPMKVEGRCPRLKRQLAARWAAPGPKPLFLLLLVRGSWEARFSAGALSHPPSVSWWQRAHGQAMVTFSGSAVGPDGLVHMTVQLSPWALSEHLRTAARPRSEALWPQESLVEKWGASLLR